MSKIIDEIKKISKDNEYDLNKFESVYDLIAEIEEEKQNLTQQRSNIEEEKTKLIKDINIIKKENEQLKENETKTKQEILDLKMKYIDRFNEPVEKKNGNNGNNENITIKDLFKEV